MNIYTQIKDLISKGEIVEAIQILNKEEFQQNISTTQRQEITLQSSRLNTLLRQARIGTVSKNEEDNTRNQIIEGVLSLLSIIEGKDLAQDNKLTKAELLPMVEKMIMEITIEKEKKTNQILKIILAVVCSTLICTALLFYVTSQRSLDKFATPKGIVPAQTPVEVENLPNDNNNDDYQLLKDISIFDLRNWKYTPENLKNTKNSAVNFTNYLHIKKLKPIKYITAHYSTTGLGMDMRCITHPAPVFKLKNKAGQFHESKNEKEYAIQIDVSKCEVGKEFLIVVEATCWNSFNDTTAQDASTYTEKEVSGMEELGLIVFFPDEKPFKELTYYNTPENEKETPYISNSTIYPDINKKFVYWSIKERLPNNHYTMKWKW